MNVLSNVLFTHPHIFWSEYWIHMQIPFSKLFSALINHFAGAPLFIKLLNKYLLQETCKNWQDTLFCASERHARVMHKWTFLYTQTFNKNRPTWNPLYLFCTIFIYNKLKMLNTHTNRGVNWNTPLNCWTSSQKGWGPLLLIFFNVTKKIFYVTKKAPSF